MADAAAKKGKDEKKDKKHGKKEDLATKESTEKSGTDEK